jgi:hypothetical protein
MVHQPKRKLQTEPPIPDDPAQSARFIEAARKLGIEQVGEAYERALERILSAPRPSEPAPTQAAEPEAKKRTRGRPKNPA